MVGLVLITWYPILIIMILYMDSWQPLFIPKCFSFCQQMLSFSENWKLKLRNFGDENVICYENWQNETSKVSFTDKIMTFTDKIMTSTDEIMTFCLWHWHYCSSVVARAPSSFVSIVVTRMLFFLIIYCRAVVVKYQRHKQAEKGMIGGPGKVVQIDESKFGKRKFYKVKSQYTKTMLLGSSRAKQSKAKATPT